MAAERVIDRLPTLEEIDQDLARIHREKSILKTLRDSIRRASKAAEIGSRCPSLSEPDASLNHGPDQSDSVATLR